jgi:hypothetical protein
MKIEKYLRSEVAEFDSVCDVNKIDFKKSGGNYEIILFGQVEYKISIPFAPDDPWDIDFFHEESSVLLDVDVGLSNKVAFSTFLDKLSSWLPKGSYFLKECRINNEITREILLGSEYGEVSVESVELLSNDRFYSALLDVPRNKENYIFLGLPILNYNGTDQCHGVLFFKLANMLGSETDDNFLIIPRSGTMVIDSYEDYLGNSTCENKRRWCEKKSLDFCKELK